MRAKLVETSSACDQTTRHGVCNHVENDAAFILKDYHYATGPRSQVVHALFDQYPADLLQRHSPVVEYFLEFCGVGKQILVGLIRIRSVVLLNTEGEPFSHPESWRTR